MLHELNPEQLAAAQHGDWPLLIVAGAALQYGVGPIVGEDRRGGSVRRHGQPADSGWRQATPVLRPGRAAAAPKVSRTPRARRQANGCASTGTPSLCFLICERQPQLPMKR